MIYIYILQYTNHNSDLNIAWFPGSRGWHLVQLQRGGIGQALQGLALSEPQGPQRLGQATIERRGRELELVSGWEWEDLVHVFVGCFYGMFSYNMLPSGKLT